MTDGELIIRVRRALDTIKRTSDDMGVTPEKQKFTCLVSTAERLVALAALGMEKAKVETEGGTHV